VLSVNNSAHSLDVTNSPMALSIFPAASAADASMLVIDAASPGVAVGQTLTAAMDLRTPAGEPRGANDTQLLIRGGVSGATRVVSSNFTYSGPGQYTYAWQVRTLELLNVSLLVDNATAGNATQLNATSMLPSVVDVDASFRAAALQRDGVTARTGVAAAAQPLSVSAGPWHMLYLPVAVLGRAGRLYADPKLGARMLVTTAVTSVAAASNSTSSNSSSTAAGQQQQLAFTGYWSSGNGSYVMPFRLPAVGAYRADVQLLAGGNNSNATVVGVVRLCVGLLRTRSALQLTCRNHTPDAVSCAVHAGVAGSQPYCHALVSSSRNVQRHCRAWLARTRGQRPECCCYAPVSRASPGNADRQCARDRHR
jgi:hypothetical protein